MGPKTRSLVSRVGLRQRIASAGSRFQLLFLVLAGVYALGLLVSRFTAVVPAKVFDPTGPLWAIALGGAVFLASALAVALACRPTPAETAHLIDKRMSTKDVFMTAVRIEGAIGEFKPLVLQQAEQAAEKVKPDGVVAFRWQPGVRNVVTAAALLAVGVWFLPQLDLLGRGQERRRIEERRRLLTETRKAVELKTALLVKNDVKAETSKPVETAVDDLKDAFKNTKRGEQPANLKSLNEQQARLSDLWRTRSEERLKDTLARRPEGQALGARSLERQAEWQKQLEKGDPSGLQKEVAEIADMARKLDQLTREEDKAQLRAEMQKRVQDLSEFVERKLNSKAASGALAQAAEQLGLSGMEGLSPEALEALKESLNLTELEIANLAQSINDLKKLEEALKALQLAKRLNDLNALDGSECAGCKGIGEYAELYKKLMEGQEGDVGAGMQGPGVGVGGKAPEDDQAKSDFVSEQSKSAMTAGKILLSWKTQELSDPGKARIDYEAQVKEVKKGVSEAVLREQIPPGYHDAIRDYFDSMEKEVVQPEKK